MVQYLDLTVCVHPQQLDCNATPDNPTCTTTTTKPVEQNFVHILANNQSRCSPLLTDANGNCQGGNIQGVDPGLPPRLGLPQQQAHYDLPVNSTQVTKLPDGSCPPGALLTTEDVCRKIPVLPGSTTGSGGGFIQMFPGAPN